MIADISTVFLQVCLSAWLQDDLWNWYNGQVEGQIVIEDVVMEKSHRMIVSTNKYSIMTLCIHVHDICSLSNQIVD